MPSRAPDPWSSATLSLRAVERVTLRARSRAAARRSLCRHTAGEVSDGRDLAGVIQSDGDALRLIVVVLDRRSIGARRPGSIAADGVHGPVANHGFLFRGEADERDVRIHVGTVTGAPALPADGEPPVAPAVPAVFCAPPPPAEGCPPPDADCPAWPPPFPSPLPSSPQAATSAGNTTVNAHTSR